MHYSFIIPYTSLKRYIKPHTLPCSTFPQPTMGGLFSTLRSALQTIKTFVDDSEPLAKRIARSPGIPQLNTSVPYWTIPLSPIAQHGRDAALPLYADVVIVGSGISGTAIAKALLDYVRDDPDSKLCGAPLKVVMLEARDACSGATGRCGRSYVD